MPIYLDSSSAGANNVLNLVVPYPTASAGSAVLLFVGHSDGVTFPSLTSAGFVAYPGSPVLAGSELGYAYLKFMGVGDVGGSLTIGPLSATAKIVAVMLAYDEVDTTNPSHAFESLAEAAATLVHQTPVVRTVIDGCAIIHACIAKDATDGVTTLITPPPGSVIRSSDFSGGSAAQWLAASGRGGGAGGGVAPGDYGGPFTSDALGAGQRHAVKWSIALAPPATPARSGTLALGGVGSLVMAAAAAGASGMHFLSAGGVWNPVVFKKLVAANAFTGSLALSGSGTLGMSGVAAGPAGSLALSGAGALAMKGFVIRTIAGLERTAEGSTVVTFPAGTVAGDCLIVRGSVSSLTLTTNPAGWTQVGSLSATGGTLLPSAYMAYRFLDAADITAGTVTITHPNNVSLWDALAVAGVNTTTPLDVAVETLDDTGGSSAVFNGLTTTGPGRLLVYVAALNSTNSTGSPPTSPGTFTETADRVTGTRSASMGHLVWPGSGATGTITVPMGGNARHVGILAAFRPA